MDDPALEQHLNKEYDEYIDGEYKTWLIDQLSEKLDAVQAENASLREALKAFIDDDILWSVAWELAQKALQEDHENS